MNIGIFDSGFGGLLMLKAIVKELPEYDYLYYGDTAHLPYGDKTQEEIYAYTKAGVGYLFEHNCALVIIACNTASAQALRRIQQEYLPACYPDRRVLGVIIPTAEVIAENKYEKIGVIATESTVASNSFIKEIGKVAPDTKIIQQATPLLVPMIEDGLLENLPTILNEYLEPLRRQDIQTLLLGCTHYPYIREELEIACGRIPVISQTDIIPYKLSSYLNRHPDLRERLTTGASRIEHVTGDKKGRLAQFLTAS